jgi:hypothetical protein
MARTLSIMNPFQELTDFFTPNRKMGASDGSIR